MIYDSMNPKKLKMYFFLNTQAEGGQEQKVKDQLN